jgi:hypothetical protein
MLLTSSKSSTKPNAVQADFQIPPAQLPMNSGGRRDLISSRALFFGQNTTSFQLLFHHCSRNPFDVLSIGVEQGHIMSRQHWTGSAWNSLEYYWNRMDRRRNRIHRACPSHVCHDGLRQGWHTIAHTFRYQVKAGLMNSVPCSLMKSHVSSGEKTSIGSYCCTVQCTCNSSPGRQVRACH